MAQAPILVAMAIFCFWGILFLLCTLIFLKYKTVAFILLWAFVFQTCDFFGPRYCNTPPPLRSLTKGMP